MAMNCTRVLHALGSHPRSGMTPMELAACLSLRQPLHPLLSPLRAATQRLSLAAPSPSYDRRHRTSPPPSPASPSERRSCFRRDHWGLKKRVSFADAKGLALTAVRLFIPEAASPESVGSARLPSTVMRRFQARQETVPTAKRQPCKLRLAFTQPSLDFKVFMSRLKDVGLQLESCSVSEYCLKGRVRVSQTGFDQSVHVRMSFDSWRSHHDIPCAFSHRQRVGAMDTDIYAFELSLPMNLDPIHGIEFGVASRTDEGALWDDNRGQNYKIKVEKDCLKEVEVVQSSPKMSRYQSLPTLAHNMTPVDIRSYSELPHLRALWHRAAHLGMCVVK